MNVSYTVCRARHVWLERECSGQVGELAKCVRCVHADALLPWWWRRSEEGGHRCEGGRAESSVCMPNRFFFSSSAF